MGQGHLRSRAAATEHIRLRRLCRAAHGAFVCWQVSDDCIQWGLHRLETIGMLHYRAVPASFIEQGLLAARQNLRDAITAWHLTGALYVVAPAPPAATPMDVDPSFKQALEVHAPPDKRGTVQQGLGGLLQKQLPIPLSQLTGLQSSAGLQPAMLPAQPAATLQQVQGVRINARTMHRQVPAVLAAGGPAVPAVLPAPPPAIPLSALPSAAQQHTEVQDAMQILDACILRVFKMLRLNPERLAELQGTTIGTASLGAFPVVWDDTVMSLARRVPPDTW